jgi:hypothetical protein
MVSTLRWWTVQEGKLASRTVFNDSHTIAHCYSKTRTVASGLPPLRRSASYRPRIRLRNWSSYLRTRSGVALAVATAVVSFDVPTTFK